MNNYKTKQKAGCLVYRTTNNELEVLLLFRIWPNGIKGCNLPKGGVEQGESYEEAALRETIEETGYTDIRIIEELDVEKITKHDKQKINEIHWFLAELISDRKENEKLTKKESLSEIYTEWHTVENAIELLDLEHDKDLIRHILLKQVESD